MCVAGAVCCGSLVLLVCCLCCRSVFVVRCLLAVVRRLLVDVSYCCRVLYVVVGCLLFVV